MRHRSVRRLGRAAAVLFCLALLPILLFGAAAGETDGGDPAAEPKEYGIFIGGKQVTDENCKDILGDGDEEHTPSVTYDPVKNLLTVIGGQGTTLESTSLVSNYDGETPKPLGRYSLYATVPDLKVEISGTVTFTHGVYLKTGSLLVWGNATKVTFLGGEDSPTYMTVGEGSITIQDGSKVIGRSLAAIRNDCFSATTLLIQDSVISIDDDGTVSDFTHVLFGKQLVRIRESTVDYHASLMGCETFLASDSGIQISGSTVRAQNVRVFLLLGSGKMSVTANSTLEAVNCLHGMQLDGDTEWKKSTVRLTSYYSGIALSPLKDATFRAQDCKITLSQPGYTVLERDILLPNAAREPDPEKYLSESRADYEAAVTKAENAGFYANRMTMEFSDCWLDIDGYLTGIFYRSAGRTISFRDGCRLSVDAASAAFIALVTEPDSVSFGSRMSGDLAVQVLPASDILGEYGKYLVALVASDGELTLTDERRIGSPQAVLDAYSGFSKRAETTVDEFRLSSVALPLGILLAAFACAVAVYLICRRVRRPRNDRRQKENVTAGAAADDSEETDSHAD